MDVTMTSDAAEFADRAGAWLADSPVENNLLLCHAFPAGNDVPGDGPSVFTWVEEPAGTVVGAAWSKPPYRMTISEMPPAAAVALAEAMVKQDGTLPGVNGPAETAGVFAARWSELTGRPVARERDQWLMSCDRLPAATGAAGTPRPARADEVELVAGWFAAIMRDSGLAADKILRHTRHMAETQFAGDRLIVWQNDDQVVGAAGWAPPLAGVVRPSGIFVAAEHRQGGYAGALLGEVTARALRGGAVACVCTHFLEYAAMRAVVEKVGYRRVSDITEYKLG